MLPFYPQREIVKCPNCFLVFYRKEIKTESLYLGDYFKGDEYRDYLADKPILQRNFKQRIKLLRKIMPHGRLFEIGSAFGFFLELAQEHWEVAGIDITPEGVDFARSQLGLNVLLGDFMNLPAEYGRYDIICMWDTIEHLSQPVRVIEQAFRWLRPGGFLLITTGNIDSFMSRWRKANWRLIHPPTHLFYFSENTLSKAVEQAGFDFYDVSYVGNFRGLKSMFHGMFMLSNKKWDLLSQIFTLGGKLDLPIYLNLYDIMLLIAQRPNI